MRMDGKLKSWNDDKGFGFITVSQGQDIFLHISALPRKDIRPQIDEPLSFDIEVGTDGKKKAVNVERPSVQSARPRNSKNNQPKKSKLSFLLVLTVLGVGAFGYDYYQKNIAPPSPETLIDESTITAVASKVEHSPSTNSRQYRCDGRQYCSQMTSCEEAYYFLEHCPDVKMDGQDHDGVPCEQQWCNR